MEYKRFYVYTPTGRLLYSINPATGEVRFYHYDRLGSTLFLTDGAGAVSDAYAYTPYGVLLDHTGESDQPFTYLGQLGVRREDAGGTLYHTRARHYDALTASFLTRDPLWPRLDSPLRLNPYAYGAGSPVHRGDATGREDEVTVSVWGFQYDFLDALTHHGLFIYMPPDEAGTLDSNETWKGPVSINITGSNFERDGKECAEIEITGSNDLLSYMDHLRDSKSGVNYYTLGPQGAVKRIRLDEARAVIRLFDTTQYHTTYDVAGGVFDMGTAEDIYCWQTSDMLQDFLVLYGIVHDQVKKDIEAKGWTYKDWLRNRTEYLLDLYTVMPATKDFMALFEASSGSASMASS